MAHIWFEEKLRIGTVQLREEKAQGNVTYYLYVSKGQYKKRGPDFSVVFTESMCCKGYKIKHKEKLFKC